MSWSVPSGVYQQPEENLGRSQQGDKTHSFSFKGPFAALETAANALVPGDVISTGWNYSSYELRRVPGDYGVLTINCVPTPGTEGSGGSATAAPLKDLWSIQSVRNDISILAYCGPSEVANPNRAMIEAWMKEPDGELARLFQFRKPDGSIVELTAASQTLAGKIAKGIESVVRFYPVVTRTRTYADCPPACLENIGFINTPPAPAGTARNPNGLSTAISAHQWLKVRDDAEEQTDGNWKRIESWWGIAKSDDGSSSPWDENLYGANRWAMPYQEL